MAATKAYVVDPSMPVEIVCARTLLKRNYKTRGRYCLDMADPEGGGGGGVGFLKGISNWTPPWKMLDPTPPLEPWKYGAPRGFGDLGRMAIYFQGSREHWLLF